METTVSRRAIIYWLLTVLVGISLLAGSRVTHLVGVTLTTVPDREDAHVDRRNATGAGRRLRRRRQGGWWTAGCADTGIRCRYRRLSAASQLANERTERCCCRRAVCAQQSVAAAAAAAPLHNHIKWQSHLTAAPLHVMHSPNLTDNRRHTH